MADDLIGGGEDSGSSARFARGMDNINESTGKASSGANAFAKAITSAFAQGVTGATGAAAPWPCESPAGASGLVMTPFPADTAGRSSGR